MAIGGAIIAAIGVAVSYYQSDKAADEREEAREVSSAQQRTEANRKNRMEARKARVRRAQLAQSASNTGVAGSSGEAGAMAGISNQQANVASYLSGSEVAATAIGSHNQKAADYEFRAQMTQEISSMASSAAADYGSKQDK